jgi:hypothetical protein
MTLPRRVVLTLLLCLCLPAYGFGSGINAGRVLTEAVVARRNQASGCPSQRAPSNFEKIEPASLVAKEGVR